MAGVIINWNSEYKRNRLLVKMVSVNFGHIEFKVIQEIYLGRSTKGLRT